MSKITQCPFCEKEFIRPATEQEKQQLKKFMLDGGGEFTKADIEKFAIDGDTSANAKITLEQA